MKDSKKISNAYYEASQAAKTLAVDVWVIYYAKWKTGTNEREAVSKWVNENRHLIEGQE